MKKKVAVIGVGIMGGGMVSNFLKNGHRVYIWNRTKEHATNLVKQGAIFCDSPREAAENAGMVFEVTANDESSKDVWLGERGILSQPYIDKRTILITSATLSIGWVDELAKKAKQNNTFFDMPLTGGRSGAESGELKLLVGGDKKLLESIKPALKSIASGIFYFGEAGNGMRFKLMLNTLSAIHINAAAQAVELVKKSGVDPTDFFEALFKGDMAPSSPATGILFRDMDIPYDHVNFSIRWIEKDLRYAQMMAETYGAELDLLDETQQDFAKAIDRGMADKDWSKVIDLYRK